MSKMLFENFKPTSSKEWKQKIQVDLKGANYNDTLIWQTNDGINVKPFYHSDENIKLDNTQMPKTWSICQTIKVNTEKEANLEALDAINRGAESILFKITSENILITELIKNINVPIHLETSFLSKNFTNAIVQTKHCYHHNDIIGNLAKSGNWFSSLNNDFETLNTILTTGTNLASTLSINVSLYQNAGATSVQQLAYALAHANEYLNHFKNHFPKTIIFNVAVGSNYFFEIAKLRALRWLWDSLIAEYNISSNCYIFAKPSKRNKTIYDYNTNMLRTTTECMSAVLGGANTISNAPYDTIYNKPNEFGNRIARNQLLILKKESYFDAVSNPSDGSYYIESLTEELAEKALTIFKQIEAQGGFLSQLKKGSIQKKIKESASKEQQQFEEKNVVLLGTNKHPNPEDKMKNDLEINPFVINNPRKTLIEPIIEKRLAEKTEQTRLQTEL